MWCKECKKECDLKSWKCECGHYKSVHAASQQAASPALAPTLSPTAAPPAIATVRPDPMAATPTPTLIAADQTPASTAAEPAPATDVPSASASASTQVMSPPRPHPRGPPPPSAKFRTLTPSRARGVSLSETVSKVSNAAVEGRQVPDATPATETASTAPTSTSTNNTTSAITDMAPNTVVETTPSVSPSSTPTPEDIPIKTVAIAVQDTKGASQEWDRGRTRGRSATADARAPSMIGKLFSSIRAKSPRKEDSSLKSRADGPTPLLTPDPSPRTSESVPPARPPVVRGMSATSLATDDPPEEKTFQALPASQPGVVPALVALVAKIANDSVQASVEAVLDLNKPIEASFDAERVKYYRAFGGGNDYSKDDVFDWNCPEFFSEIPLPPNVKCNCVMHLDKETKVTFRIKDQEKCAELLQRALEKTQSRTAMGEVSATNYILKVLGKCEYLDGDSLVLDHLCVREAIRAEKPVSLVLVKRPENLFPKSSPWKEWGGGVPQLPTIDFLPISETLNNFRARSVGVLSVNMPPEVQKNASIQVKLMLLHGSTVLAQDVTIAPAAAGTRNFQFARDLAPPLTRLAQLPRETSVCFAVLLAEGNQSTLLGWLRLHLFDERGILLQGFHTTDIREPMKLPQDVGFDSELISRLARGPVGFPPKGTNGCVLNFQLEEFDKPVMYEEPRKSVAVAGRVRSQSRSTAPMNFRPFQLPPRQAPTTDNDPSTPSSQTLRNNDNEDSPNYYPFPASPPPRFAVTLATRLPHEEKERDTLFMEEVAKAVAEDNSNDDRGRLLEVGTAPSRSRASSRSRKEPPPSSSGNELSLDERLARDPSLMLSAADKQHLWDVRHTMVFMDKPEILTAFFQSIDWCDVEKRSEAHRMLDLLVPSPLETALQLLDVKFPDTKLREYAVQSLSHISILKLQPYLLQLTQCLKYEPYHHSALANFLIQAALKHPLTIGQPLYWHLRSEMSMQPAFAERYALILASYLSHGGPLVRELRKQKAALEQLQRVAETVALRKESDVPKEDIMEEYVGELVKLNCYLFARWGKMRLPFNPLVEVTTLLVDKCRFMSSKKVPLWLVFQNADPNETEPVYVMFKSGDDLRQDMLTLQILSYMDEVWRQENIDLRLTTYRVIATGVNAANEGLGMIEVVLNADTTSGIQHEFGGGALGAFKLAPLKDYLGKHNTTETSLNLAVERFMRSSAGYCVATYIMGIGDRHNGNIMVSKDGHLFHIDFGHFLGNFKSKFGIRRERAPFVFTPEMAFVIGGKQFQQHPAYQQFEKLCVQAFNAIRTRAGVLNTLFGLMVSAGMPELLSEEDVSYMWEQLCLDLSPTEAAGVFLKELETSVSATSRRIDNFFHIAKHG